MKLKKFIIPCPEDGRLIYTANYLKQCGYLQVFDKSDADFAVFAPAQSKESILSCSDITVYYGAGDYDGNMLHYYDYNKREDFKFKNAVLTAEGAVALYKENSDVSFSAAKVVIIGYGRIAKSLHRALRAFGADVTVCARSDINKAQATANGAKTIDFSCLNLQGFDVIFNTVPSVIFTKAEIDTFDPDVKYIELASFPGGIDRHYAKVKKVNIIDGAKLPKRYSKATAGEIIGDAVDKMIKEGMV